MTEVLKSLLSYLDETEAEDAKVQSHEGFIIESIDQANYFARKLKEVREQKNEIATIAQEQLQKYTERVNAWREASTKPLDSQEERILSMLKTYTEQTLQGSSKRSIKLVEGTLALRAQAPAYTYNDEVLIDSLKRVKPDLVSVKTTESVDKAALKKTVEIAENGTAMIDGVPISGVTIEKRPDTFDVK